MTPRFLESLNSVFHFKDTLRLLYPVRVLALGLVVSQLIGTVLVYLSNLALAGKIAAIQAAGYGPLPGVNIDPPLSGFEAALAGGIFFTLSIGAGVVLFTFGAVLLSSALPPLYRVFKNKALKTGWRMLALAALVPAAAAAAAAAIGWPVALVWGNIRGLCYGFSAFLLLVPPIVIWAALKWSPRRTGQPRLPWRNFSHFVLIAVLFGLWASRVNADVFVNIKDNLLLTSRPGIRIVHLYYQYTLYPAEVFKRPADRQLKTCVLEGVDDSAVAGRLERVLRAHDYFLVSGSGTKADLTMVQQGTKLSLGRGKKAVLVVDRERFMKSAGETLKRFSEKTDTGVIFRRFTIVSLVGMAPLVLYLTSYAVFCLLPGLLAGIRVSSFLVPVLCFGFWTGVMMVLDTPPVTEIDQSRAATAISGGDRRERLAALRYIYENELDIADFEGYRGLFETTDFAQRYWLVRNLGNSRDRRAAVAILRFLRSDSPYIVCKAIEAAAAQMENRNDMARRHYRRLLVQKLGHSNNWYVQFYAYKAARRAGWIPEKSG